MVRENKSSCIGPECSLAIAGVIRVLTVDGIVIPLMTMGPIIMLKQYKNVPTLRKSMMEQYTCSWN